MLTKSRLLVAAAVAPLLLTACLDSSTSNPYGPSGPTANLQVLHASPDAPAVNVLIDGQPALNDLDYAQGTGELWIAAGSHTVTIQAQTPSGPTTLVGPTSVDLQQGNDYVIVAEGPAASIGTVVFSHPLSVVAATATRVQVLHAAPNSPAVAVYLTAPAADLTTATPLGTGSVAFMGGIGPNDVPQGAYELRITPAGATAPVLFDSGTINLIGGTDLVVTALQNTGPGPSPLMLSVVDAYGNDSQLFDVATPANVRVVHDSPDAPPVSVIANGNVATPLVPTLAYEGSTAYLPLTPGFYTFNVTPAGSTSQVLAMQALTLYAGTEQTIYALGNLATMTAQVSWDDRRRVATAAKLRIIDGSPTAGLVDIYVTTTGANIASLTPTYAGVPFTGDTGFQGFAAGSYDVTVTPAGSKTAAIGPVNISIITTGIYTMVVRDAPGGGAPYGFILLDDL